MRNARLLAWCVAAACVLGALWFVREGLREVGPAKAGQAAPLAPVEAERAPVSVVAPAPTESAERAAVAPAEVAASARGEEGAKEPPTPAHPGPGQALLRVTVGARETGQPLAGVELELTGTEDHEGHEWSSSTQSDPARGVENDTVLTDADGRGEFVVQAEYAYTLHGEGPNGLARIGELALEPFREGEAREVRLELSTAWDFAWHGRVVDENELPLAGVDVRAYARHDGIEELLELARGQSDGDGRVVLRLPEWESESACAFARAPGRFLAGRWIRADARSPETAQRLVLRRSAALSALVTDPAGRPAAGIEVRLTARGFAAGEDVGGLPLEWSRSTDGDGRCQFTELPAAAELEAELLPAGRMPQHPEGSRFELAPGEHEVRWSLLAGATVEVRVRRPEGTAVRGVSVALRSLPRWSDEHGERMRGQALPWFGFLEGGVYTSTWSESDADGRARFEDVPAGWWALGPDDNDWPDVVEIFRVPPELGRVELELVLESGRIRGTVLAPDGEPARGARISWRGSEPRLANRQGSDRAEDDGSFELSTLAPGEYRIEATHDDPLCMRSEAVLGRTGDEAVEIRLRPAGIARGTVVDTEGQLVEAAVSALTDVGWDDGRFESSSEFDIGHLVPGLHDFVALDRDGRIGVLRDVRIAGGQVLEGLVIVVSEGAELTVDTRNESGADFWLEITCDGVLLPPGGDGFPADNLTDTVPPGEIVVRWLRREEGELRFEHEERRTVAAGERVRVEWELR